MLRIEEMPTSSFLPLTPKASPRKTISPRSQEVRKKGAPSGRHTKRMEEVQGRKLVFRRKKSTLVSTEPQDKTFRIGAFLHSPLPRMTQIMAALNANPKTVMSPYADMSSACWPGLKMISEPGTDAAPPPKSEAEGE